MKELRSVVRSADGLLLVTPEYNHGVSGTLKKCRRLAVPAVRNSGLEVKTYALLGASTGMAGTARGQSQLRQAFVLTNSPAMHQPEVLLARAQEKFDAMGCLTDQRPDSSLRVSDALAHWLADQKRLSTPASSC